MSVIISKEDRQKIAAVENAVADFFDQPPALIHTDSRMDHIVKMRFMVWYVLKNKFHLSFSSIGNFYGKDHTTVIHGYSQILGQGLDDLADALCRDI